MSKQQKKVTHTDEYDKKPSYDKYSKPVPVTENHNKYHNLLKDESKKIVVCNGYAGTGKSIVSVYYACKQVLAGKARGIVLVKEMDDSVGFLKGDINEKYLPKVRQLLKYAECFLQCDYRLLIQDEILVVQPLSYLQGMDYTGYIMIVDEAELISPEMMYCICSRGANRVFINGDTSPLQANARHIKQGKDGISFLMDSMSKSNTVGMVTMDKEEDIVRDGYIKTVIINMQPALEEFKNK